MAAGRTFRVEDGGELKRLALELKEAGRNDLRLQMMRGLRKAAQPAKEAVQQSAREELPKAGGYAELVADSIAVRMRLTGKSANIRVQAVHQDYRVNQGILRHPVFGHKEQQWVNQEVPVGWFTRPLLAMAPEVTAAMTAVMTETARAAGFK